MSPPRIAMAGRGRTRVLWAVVAVHEAKGRVDYADLSAATGMAKSTLHVHLQALRAQALVAWEPATAGTIRPLVATVGEWAA